MIHSARRRLLAALMLAVGLAISQPPQAHAQDEEDVILQDGESEGGSADLEGESYVEGGDSSDAPEGSPGHGRGKSPQPSRKVIRDKQAEGTKAKKRSNQDFVIHSQYELNGRKLEVDPD